MTLNRSNQQWPAGEVIDLTRNYGIELPLPERTLVERVCEVVDWYYLERLRGKLCQ